MVKVFSSENKVLEDKLNNNLGKITEEILDFYKSSVGYGDWVGSLLEFVENEELMEDFISNFFDEEWCDDFEGEFEYDEEKLYYDWVYLG